MKITKKQLERAIRKIVAESIEEAPKNPAFNKTMMDLPRPKPKKEIDPMRQRQMNLPKSEAALDEGAQDRFDKLDQLREVMSDEDILVELVKMMPDHEWAEHHKTMMQYFSGDPDYGMNSEDAHDLDTDAILEDAMDEDTYGLFGDK